MWGWKTLETMWQMRIEVCFKVTYSCKSLLTPNGAFCIWFEVWWITFIRCVMRSGFCSLFSYNAFNPNFHQQKKWKLKSKNVAQPLSFSSSSISDHLRLSRSSTSFGSSGVRRMATMESKSLIGVVNRIQSATSVADSRPSVVAQGSRPRP